MLACYLQIEADCLCVVVCIMFYICRVRFVHDMVEDGLSRVDI